jgi:regulator of RNase E activity RraB
MDYPNDADGDALRRIAADGSDMSKPMEIDFAVAAPNEHSASAIAKAAASKGYRTDIERDDAGTWSCCCTRKMIATYKAVTEAQAELDALSRPLGAHADGWGTPGNAPAE